MCVCVSLCMYVLQILSVSYEEFAVALDEKFGQSLWSDFPEVTNKGELGWTRVTTRYLSHGGKTRQ